MDVIALRTLGIGLGLDLTEKYINDSYKVLEKVCNGIGPEWFSEDARDAVTDYFEYFLPSTNPHDHDFAFLEKTDYNFYLANDRLLKNMKVQIEKDQRLTWFSFSKDKSRWRKHLQASFLYRMCEEFGEKSFYGGE